VLEGECLHDGVTGVAAIAAGLALGDVVLRIVANEGVEVAPHQPRLGLLQEGGEHALSEDEVRHHHTDRGRRMPKQTHRVTGLFTCRTLAKRCRDTRRVREQAGAKGGEWGGRSQADRVSD
jgi:hypothetical protein